MRDKHGLLPEFNPVSKIFIIAPAFLVALVTFLLFLPALQNDIVNWDDHLYVWQNLNIRSLDMAFVKWVLTSLVASNWHPVTMLSHAIDYRLFGLEPWGHHLTSLVIHALNTLLLYVLVYTLYLRSAARSDEQGGRTLYAVICAITASLLFGLHPIHVESVVWISERKDLLCALFYLSSVIFYLKSAEKDGGWKVFYALSILSFLLALLSKPMAVSLPLVLLIIDYFPLHRLNRRNCIGAAIEKGPYFILAFAFSILTFLSQSSTGAVVKLVDTSLYERVLVSAHAYSFYLYKLLWPADLAPLYPFPFDIGLGSLEFLISILIFISLTIFSLLIARRQRVIPALWAYYVITLLPVIGIVRVGHHGAADRYTYLPSVALFILAGLLFAYIVRRLSSRRAVAAAALSLILILVLLSSLTVRQSAVWKDSVTLWSHEIKLYPRGSFIAYMNRASAYEEAGEFKLALADYTTSIELNPDDSNLYLGRGMVYYNKGKISEAIAEFQKAIEIMPEHTGAYISLGVISQDRGDFAAAVESFSTAIEIDSQHGEAYLHRGISLVNMNRADEGVKDIQSAIDLGERGAESYNARALAYYNLDDLKRAEEDYLTSLEKDPLYAEVYYNLGLLYAVMGQIERARESFEKAGELGLIEADEALRKLF
jgi:tetratricopeptide (TPR) repeat protein